MGKHFQVGFWFKKRKYIFYKCIETKAVIMICRTFIRTGSVPFWGRFRQAPAVADSFWRRLNCNWWRSGRGCNMRHLYQCFLLQLRHNHFTNVSISNNFVPLYELVSYKSSKHYDVVNVEQRVNISHCAALSETSSGLGQETVCFIECCIQFYIDSKLEPYAGYEPYLPASYAVCKATAEKLELWICQELIDEWKLENATTDSSRGQIIRYK